MKKLTLLLFISTMLMGCSSASQDFVVYDHDEYTTKVSVAQTFFFGGLFQSAYINASEICGGPDNILSVEAINTEANSYVSIITLGIYTPRQVDIYCKSRS